MALLIALGYLAMEQRNLFERGSTGRYAMVQSHYWIGLTVFVLAWWRIVQRRRFSAPAITPALPRLQAGIGGLMHVLLGLARARRSLGQDHGRPAWPGR